MANNKEKELLGLGKDATDEQVQERIMQLLVLEKTIKERFKLSEDADLETMQKVIQHYEPSEPTAEDTPDEKLIATAESYFKDNPFADVCYLNRKTGDLFAQLHQAERLGVLADDLCKAQQREGKILITKPNL